jgi:hypothetical protein
MYNDEVAAEKSTSLLLGMVTIGMAHHAWIPGRPNGGQRIERVCLIRVSASQAEQGVQAYIRRRQAASGAQSQYFID